MAPSGPRCPGVALAYISANLLISERAFAAIRQATNGRAEAMFASPPPILSWRRDLLWREGDCYRRSSFDLGRFAPPSACEPTNLASPWLRAAIARDPSMRRFLRWSVLPQAALRRERCTVRVTVGDARYGSGGRSRLSHETPVPTAAPGCPLDTASAQP